jgi:hypothetical protein
VTLALALVISGILARTPIAPPAANGSFDDLCGAPPPAAASSMQVVVSGVTMQVPSSFAVAASASYYQMYSTGKVSVQLWVGHRMPRQPNMQSLKTCHVTLGGRPATITLYTIPASLSPVASLNAESMARHDISAIPTNTASVTLFAEWLASDGIGVVDVAIVAQYQSDLLPLRQLFWTVQFPGSVGNKVVDPDCAKAPAAPPKIAEVLDTGVVSMMVTGSTPPLPAGNAIFEFAFDSTGGMYPLAITRSSISDSAVRRLALIVGSNVKDQPPGAKRFGVRVEIAPEGMSYSTLPVSSCGAH